MLMLGFTGASFFFTKWREPLRELDPDGGGDFNRGDTGHCGVASPDAVPLLLACLGNLDVASAAGAGCIPGTLAAESALWIAAADG